MKKNNPPIAGPVLDEQVCYNLYVTSNVITQAYKSLLDELGLTYPQFVVMMALWQQDNISVTALAENVGITKATMTPILKRLEKIGYIQREKVDNDDRRKAIVLTEMGKESVSTGNEIAKQALCATGLSMQEAESLIQLCQKIRLNLTS